MTQTIWIDDATQLRDFCQELASAEAIAVDTESDHFHAYQAQVCLIQVGTPRVAALVDPLAIDARGLAPLFEVFSDPAVVKILHAGRNDIIGLDRDWDTGITNLFDTNVASRFLGYERHSLSWLVQELLGAESSGQFQRFDWTTRPIPQNARHYACEDVVHLFALRDRFTDELDADGWLEAHHQQCVHIAHTATYEPKAFDPEGWRHIKAGRGLDGRGRAALRDLFIWRHELCTRVNRAALHVFQNSALVRVAKVRPSTADELAAVKGMSRQTLERNTDEILDVVKRSLTADIPPERLPRRSHDAPPPEEADRFGALRKWRNATSDQLGIPGEFIATNATLQDLAQRPPQNLEDLRDFPDLLPWHRDRFGAEILRVVMSPEMA